MVNTRKDKIQLEPDTYKLTLPQFVTSEATSSRPSVAVCIMADLHIEYASVNMTG